MQGSKIPATVITGFLGAGKTTLVRSMLENANGKKIALIINEFGDLGVDGDVLKGCGAENCTEEDIVELTNGCICCTVADDFIPTMVQLLERENKPDHIVIETSGLALPQPLIAAFNWPEIRTQITVDGVVSVVDSAAVAEGRFAHDHDKVDALRKSDETLDHETPLEELFEDQLIAADLIVLNKADLVSDAQIAQIESDIRSHLSRKPSIIKAQNGQVPVDVLLGLGVGSESDIENRKSHHERAHDAAHVDGSDHTHDHDHDEFESFVVGFGVIDNVDAFKAGLEQVIEQHDVLRAKGFLHVEGKPMRLVVQAVGRRIDCYFDRKWDVDEARNSRLVVIGLHDIDKSDIEKQICNLAV